MNSTTVREKWTAGEMSDVEALIQLCHNHLNGDKVAFFVISDIVVYMSEKERNELKVS